METRAYKFWFATGSQDLYGDECLSHVAAHSKQIVDELNKSGRLPFEIVWKPTLIDNASIRQTFAEANADRECAGVITWMHTFSPAKSWILGLSEFRKPLLHLHTQFNNEIPYDTIDMDFMNENQSAHGDREYGHIVTRMGIERKVIMGHWADTAVQDRIAGWMRTAIGVMESSHIRVARIADNMRNVAVTEGDKVEAQIKFGWEIDAWPVNDAVEYIDAVSESDIKNLTDEYYDTYDILLEGRDEKEFREHVAVQAQIEIGLRKFLEEKDYQAIVTHFGDLGGMKQLPGLAIQRLMADGYGFGAEGDWKTAAMVRLMKIMTTGMKDAKGTSFMEDYTYNLIPGKEGILRLTCLRFARLFPTDPSVSRFARFPWVTVRIPPVWYLLQRQVPLSRHHLSTLVHASDLSSMRLTARRLKSPCPSFLLLRHSGHRDPISPLVQRHGSMQAVLIILLSLMTLLQSRWLTGQMPWVSRLLSSMQTPPSAHFAMRCAGIQ